MVATKGILEKKDQTSKENITGIVIMGLVGLVLALIPDAFNNLIGIIVGLSLLIIGLASIFQYMQNKIGTNYNLVTGILYSVLGAFIMLYPGSVLRLIAVCLGVYLIINGLMKVSLSFALKEVSTSWVGTLIIGILIVILGVILIFNPFSGVAITKITGIFLVIVALFNLIDHYVIQKR